MKALILRANPRKQGYTQHLTNLFINGLRQGQAQVHDIDLTTQKINHCIGCYNCWIITPGKCIHQDDMSRVMNAFTSCDIVVFSSPLYIYNISGYLKVFLDRLLPYMKNEHLSAGQESIRNAIRNPDQWPSKMAYLLVGAFRGSNAFEGARKTLELFAEGLQLPLCGSLIRPESYLLPFKYLKPKTIRAVYSAFEKAGFEFAAHGKISNITMKKASAPLSQNIKHFLEDSNIYWQEAQALGPAAINPSDVNDLVIKNPKILISEMTRHFNPQTTAQLKACIEFHFTDKNVHFLIKIDNGKCFWKKSNSKNYDLLISTTSEVWSKIFLREINPRQALVEKKILLKGDKSLFARLDKYFPLPFD